MIFEKKKCLSRLGKGQCSSKMGYEEGRVVIGYTRND